MEVELQIVKEGHIPDWIFQVMECIPYFQMGQKEDILVGVD